MSQANPAAPKRFSQVPAWVMSALLLTVAYSLLGLTFTTQLSHASIMQRCVLVNPNMARIWSVGNVEIGMAYLGVFGAMLWYFVRIFGNNRAHLTDLALASLYLLCSFTLDFVCVQHLEPFPALLIGDAIVMTFTVIVSRQLWFQRLLGVFVPIIFLTCGIGHLLEGLSYWHQTYTLNVPWTMVTADIGFAVLVNSARFPAFIRGQDVVEDLAAAQARADSYQAQVIALNQAQTALRESEERFRTTFEHAAIGIAHVALDGRWLRVNPKLCEIVGYTREELLARTFQEITYPEDLETDLELLRRLLADEIPTYTLEKRYLHQQGHLIWINLTVTLMRDAAGKPDYCIAIIEDISERKRAAAEIETLNHRLRRAMAETHHRIKNNLQVISALVDLQLTPEIQSVPAEQLKRIGSHVGTLAVVHDILTQVAKKAGDAQVVPAKTVLDKLIAALREINPQNRIIARIEDIEVSMQQGTAISLAVNELVSNAVKYGKGDIEVSLLLRDSEVVLEVCNEGPGFPSGFSRQADGNIGLELVENLATWDLRGQIEYDNPADGRARVRITFPLVERSSLNAPAAMAS